MKRKPLYALKKNILFVVNPISGGKPKQNFAARVEQHLDKAKYQASYVFSEYRGHAAELAAEACLKGTDILVAVGGDGTINEVAGIALKYQVPLGIIPLGSGNGLARSLGIPLKLAAAIKRLNGGETMRIDAWLLNQKPFFNMAGMGFDAHISSCFAENKQRGVWGYIKATFREFKKYKPQVYRIEIDGQAYTRKAFMISLANSSQYGNNAHIAPFASLTDGILDVCIIKPFALSYLPIAAWRMLKRTAHRSKYVEIIKGKKLSVMRDAGAPVHLDGEPVSMPAEIQVEIERQSLAVLT